jgi:hypothetical protein
MNDAAVARAGEHADARHLLEHENVTGVRGQLGRNGAADHSASNNDDACLLHRFPLA